MRVSRKEKFLRLIEPEPNSGCWFWAGTLYKSGYGSFASHCAPDGSGRNSRAHRYAWELFVGPIPDGMKVLHRCDQRSCVNPDHLFLGTHQDNMDDMAIKGRGRKSWLHSLPPGVAFDRRKSTKPFHAYVKFHRSQVYVGVFATATEAARAAKQKRLALRLSQGGLEGRC